MSYRIRVEVENDNEVIIDVPQPPYFKLRWWRLWLSLQNTEGAMVVIRKKYIRHIIVNRLS